MKNAFLIIALFCSFSVSAQKFYTNKPEVIYPAMERYIAENYQNQTEVLQKLQKIDSIIVQPIEPRDDGDGTIFFRFGYTHIWQKTTWIEIHPFILKYPQLFESVFIHELGHVIGMKHIPVKGLPADAPERNEIMTHNRPDDLSPEEFERVKKNYYSQLHQLLMPKAK